MDFIYPSHAVTSFALTKKIFSPAKADAAFKTITKDKQNAGNEYP
jgi:hypothetical protein